ncbi:zinc knuckle transcription factor [Penicillium capsulatum]|nr:zinc knuckle transcription factor [Penicillium capsulatum]
MIDWLISNAVYSHTKAECPKPRVFQGTCRTCGQEGHPAFQCPEKPPAFCRNCKREGHLAKDCTVNRKFDLNDVADKLPEEAWAMMKKASDERDIDDFREAFKVYTKAVPTATYVDIEKKLREEKFNVYLIALDKEAEDVITLIDLQGRLDAKYAVRFSLNDKPRRANLKDRWPADEAENMERLADAGQPFDRHIMKCQMGHGSRACKQERVENERLQIKCVNCDEPGHRLRDCPEPRLNKGGCRNCGSEEHHAKDCPEPRSLAGVECRKCNDSKCFNHSATEVLGDYTKHFFAVGHFAKDCPNESVIRTCRNCGSEDHMARDCDQPRDESTMTCRNCDQVGHVSRDCPEPKNWSRVKCNRCGEMGHTIRRCRQPEEGAEGEVCFYRPNAENVENDERHHGEIEEQVDLISDEFANQAW